MNILITGAAGFIGSNFARYMVNKYPEHKFIIFDKLTYAGNLENLKDLEGKSNYYFVKGDVCDLNFLTHLLKGIDVVFHLAAESHVDNSIGNSIEFTKTNTYGTHVLLEAAHLNKVKKFIHVSTDEVYGDIIDGQFKESDKLSPNNPYSASKAAAEMIVWGYYRTYNLPVIVIRGNNVYGYNQYPEKIVSKFICHLLMDKKIPVHGEGKNIRTYIFTDDVCRALDTIFNKGSIGETYNIGTHDEISNIDLAKLLLKKMNKDESYIQHIPDRPFNDIRYSLDLTKIKGLGWNQEVSFEEGITKTIEWYSRNPSWWLKLIERNSNPNYAKQAS